MAQRSALDLDAPVAEYWPEFADAGKAHIPVRWLLSHRAGLPALDAPIPLADALAWHPMITALAAQRPLWVPGSAHGYHTETFGWLVGEVIRRITGRTPGRFFAAEIPASNGITTAAALARFYHALIDPTQGYPLLNPATLATATTVESEGLDLTLGVPTCFGLGYSLPSTTFPLFGPGSFGHGGHGGSFGFAHLPTRTTIG